MYATKPLGCATGSYENGKWWVVGRGSGGWISQPQTEKLTGKCGGGADEVDIIKLHCTSVMITYEPPYHIRKRAQLQVFLNIST